MPLGFDGSGSITGLIAGGLPNSTITQSEILGNAGGFQHMDVYAPGTTNWTVPDGVTKARVTVVGGGGGGGGTSPSLPMGYGGGAGGVGVKMVALTPGSVVTITVGAAGTAASNAAGGAGGTSSFGSEVTCTGGAGGTRAVQAGGISSSTNGTSTGGDINLQGKPYYNFITSADFTAQAIYWSSGPGVDTALGLGFGGRGRFYNANAAGIAATGYGAGGGGAYSVGANLAGGAGAPGVVIVEY